MSLAIEPVAELAHRCYGCFRPLALCYCASIPRIDNRTDVLILQHARERFHPFNTARMVKQSLKRCDLAVLRKRPDEEHCLPIQLQPGAGLLYPSEHARLLSDLPADVRPSQLVVVDGTWHQAKTLVRDLPQLRSLPCYRLSPASPGQFRIRREPHLDSLSTVEATVAALQALEPDTQGLDQLLTVFHRMIADQLVQAGSHEAWRRNRKRQTRPRDMPLALLGDPTHLVIAYGEATPGRPGKRTTSPSPVNWVARRLGTGEDFSCLLRQQPSLTSTSLQHLRLTAADFHHAVDPEEFSRQWSQFLSPHDVLIVYHQRTSQLLRSIGATVPPTLVLKSIFGKWRAGFRSQEELLLAEGLPLRVCGNPTRASERLAMSITLVEHLRTRGK